jgi:hypothetical protein
MPWSAKFARTAKPLFFRPVLFAPIVAGMQDMIMPCGSSRSWRWKKQRSRFILSEELNKTVQQASSMKRGRLLFYCFGA